jgi:hypothetical protein
MSSILYIGAKRHGQTFGPSCAPRHSKACAVAAPVDPGVALDYLANLPRLWEDAAPERRQQIAGALFERIDVQAVGAAVLADLPKVSLSNCDVPEPMRLGAAHLASSRSADR